MKTRPIIFSAEMILAILDNRKGQTRRLIKPQPTWIESSGRWCWDIPSAKIHAGCCKSVVTASREWWEYLTADQFPCQPGDRMWVREVFSTSTSVSQDSWKRRKSVVYKANEGREHGVLNNVSWKSPLFMPRWASRITLEITGVRVERVQDIGEAHASAEGFKDVFDGKTFFPAGHFFKTTWDSLNAKRGFGWDANPWVWVISFKRIEGATP
ncbi:MAG: ASCH domain-containing protein [Candidatus Aminicenantales bacterium]